MTVKALTYAQKFVAGEFYHMAPLPVNEQNYPYGFTIKLRSTHGETKNIAVSPAQLKKIEQILLGGA